jgi:hypothetical protein
MLDNTAIFRALAKIADEKNGSAGYFNILFEE